MSVLSVVWGPTGGKFPSECVVCSVESYRREIPQIVPKSMSPKCGPQLCYVYCLILLSSLLFSI